MFGLERLGWLVGSMLVIGGCGASSSPPPPATEVALGAAPADGAAVAGAPPWAGAWGPPDAPSPAGSQGGALAVGDRVSCNWKSGGTYYDGRVAEVADGGRVVIHYDDGDVEETTPDKCRALSAATAKKDSLAGTYAIVSAKNPNGSTYTGSVSISEAGDAYELAWSIPGGAPYRGVGVVVGSVLAVGWGTGGGHGVVAYRVAGGQLSGQWAQLGGRGPVGLEDLSGPSGLSGTYQITRSRTPSGGTYSGSVSITPTGDTFDLRWTLPRESYTGVGVTRGDVLAVGWGASKPGVVAYVMSGTGPGARLEGVWATPAGTSLGQEVLERRR